MIYYPHCSEGIEVDGEENVILAALISGPPMLFVDALLFRDASIGFSGWYLHNRVATDTPAPSNRYCRWATSKNAV